MQRVLTVFLLFLLAAAPAAAQLSPVVVYDPMPNMNAILGAANMDGDVAEEIVVLYSIGERLMIIDSASGNVDFDSQGWGWNYIYPPGYEHETYANEAFGNNHGYDIFCDKNGDGIMELMVIVSTGPIYEQQLAIVSLVGGQSAAPDAPARPGAALDPARPNPFNPATSIDFVMGAEGRAVIRVYDVAGRLVRTLLDERRPAGRHTAVWDGRDDDGRTAASGTYFYQLETEGRTYARKAMLLK